MASFQVIIGWKRPRKIENKNYRSVPFRSYPMHNGKFQKKAKKLKILKKIPLLLHFNPKQAGKGREKQEIKIVVPFLSYPMRNRKFHKNKKKI